MSQASWCLDQRPGPTTQRRDRLSQKEIEPLDVRRVDAPGEAQGLQSFAEPIPRATHYFGDRMLQLAASANLVQLAIS